jgi:regulatory protein
VAEKDAFERALEALSGKERTHGELEAWLRQRDFTAEEIADALERLVSIGELDDERFARRFAEDKRELRGWGASRIREALSARGVDGELIEAALGEEDHSSQLERAIAVLERRGEGVADDAGRARALGHLTRRGYDYELAYEAVRTHERRAF